MGARKCASLTAVGPHDRRSAIRIKPHSDRSAAVIAPTQFVEGPIISYTAAIAVVRPDVSLLRCLSAAGWAAALVVVWYTLTLPLHFGTAN